MRYVGALAGCLITGTVLNTFVLTENFQLASLTATSPGLTLCAATAFVRQPLGEGRGALALALLFGLYFVQYFATVRG